LFSLIRSLPFPDSGAKGSAGKSAGYLEKTAGTNRDWFRPVAYEFMMMQDQPDH